MSRRFLGNAFTGLETSERVARSPTPYPISSVGKQPAENELPNWPATAVAPGS